MQHNPWMLSRLLYEHQQSRLDDAQRQRLLRANRNDHQDRHRLRSRLARMLHALARRLEPKPRDLYS